MLVALEKKQSQKSSKQDAKPVIVSGALCLASGPLTWRLPNVSLFSIIERVDYTDAYWLRSVGAGYENMPHNKFLLNDLCMQLVADYLPSRNNH